jgi:hypothetical protein
MARISPLIGGAAYHVAKKGNKRKRCGEFNQRRSRYCAGTKRILGHITTLLPARTRLSPSPLGQAKEEWSLRLS